MVVIPGAWKNKCHSSLEKCNLKQTPGDFPDKVEYEIKGKYQKTHEELNKF